MKVRSRVTRDHVNPFPREPSYRALEAGDVMRVFDSIEFAPRAPPWMSLAEAQRVAWSLWMDRRKQ